MNKIKRRLCSFTLGLVALVAMAAAPVQQAEAATVDVSWVAADPAHQVFSYKVYCATNGTSNPGLVATVAAPATTWSSTFPNGSVYYFSVSQVNMAGESARSNATSTPALPPAPAAPTVNTSP